MSLVLSGLLGANGEAFGMSLDHGVIVIGSGFEGAPHA
jgi:hypothetical protein